MEPKLTARGKDVGQLRPPPTGALVKGDLGIMGPQAKGFQEPEGSLPTHLHRCWPLGRITPQCVPRMVWVQHDRGLSQGLAYRVCVIKYIRY